jgi:hypothetical protein
MLKRCLSRLFLSGSALLLLSSCGGGSDLGGGIGEFTTVEASATVATSRLESDVLTGNTCSATGSAGGTFSTDSVDVTVASRALFPNALNLLISKITVHYEPANIRTPRLPDHFIPITRTIAPGGSQTIPVAVFPDNYKLNLVSEPSLSSNMALCSADYFEYYVTITFEVSEPGGNGNARNVPAPLLVAIADRNS